MAMSQSDLYSLAVKEGLSEGQAKIAAAIGMAESGGNPNAHNTNASTGDNSYGLWQINMLGALGPERLRQFGISSNDQLFDPATNAKAMRILSQDGRSFTPWSVYKNGSYNKYINNRVILQLVKEPGIGDKIIGAIPGVDAIASTVDGMASIADAVGKTANWVSDSKNWIRVAYVGGGAILAIGALVSLVGATRVGKVATKVATKGMV